MVVLRISNSRSVIQITGCSSHVCALQKKGTYHSLVAPDSNDISGIPLHQCSYNILVPLVAIANNGEEENGFGQSTEDKKKYVKWSSVNVVAMKWHKHFGYGAFPYRYRIWNGEDQHPLPKNS